MMLNEGDYETVFCLVSELKVFTFIIGVMMVN